MEALYNMLEGFNHGGDWVQITMKMLTAAVVFTISTVQNCNTHQFIYDSITYCFKGQCGGFYAMTNILSSMAPILISFGGILQAVI